MLKCTNCGADIPEVSRFCLSCGREVPPPKQIMEPVKEDDEPNIGSIMLWMFSFMIFFFMLVPIFLGSWIGAAIMGGIGLVLALLGYANYRAAKKKVERAQEKAEEKALIRIKCKYCGSLNHQEATRCDSCGATL